MPPCESGPTRRARVAVIAAALLIVGLLPGLPGVAAAAGEIDVTRTDHPGSGDAVAIAPAPDGGSWTVDADGVVSVHDGAAHHGDVGGVELWEPIVGMAASPSGGGYWLVAADGGVFTFGDASFFGSAGDVELWEPIVGMAASPSGGGYWLVAADGGVFTFGDVDFHGSPADLDEIDVVGLVPTGGDDGYWVVDAATEIDAFGTAPELVLPAGTADAVAAVAAGPSGNLLVALVEPDDDAATGPSGNGPDAGAPVDDGEQGGSPDDVEAGQPVTAEPGPGDGTAVPPTEAERFVAGLPPDRLAIWDALAVCESGGDWSIDTGNGFYGGLQFALGSWHGVGGTGHPHHHDRVEQIFRGELLLDLQGWGAWPSCARRLGLR